MKNKEIILHLSLIDGIGPVTIKKLLRNKPETFALVDLYNVQAADCMRLFGFSHTISQKIVAGLRNKKNLEKELSLIEKYNINWTSLWQDDFPQLLSEIYAPPSVFYWQGAEVCEEKNIAIIGSRKAHRYAQEVVSYFVPELVQHGWTIVSGGALGADSMAHREAVKAGGATVVVLGSGLLRPYPSSHKNLFDSVLKNGGTLVSAFPLETQARPGNFPARNRIIAGLSHGCVVVQAAKKSGARITAQFALEQGREVFAVPGPVGDELSVGCHALIQEGAKLVGSVEDILVEFDPLFSKQDDKIKKADSKKKTKNSLPSQGSGKVVKKKEQDLNGLNEVEAQIVGACKFASSVDDIASAVQRDPAELHELLLDLQFGGYIQQNYAGLWERA